MKKTLKIKKLIPLLTVIAVIVTGCTQIPPSAETGVMPSEYNGTNKTNSSEINDLKTKLEEKDSELQKAKNNFERLDKDNAEITKKLTEAENALKGIKKTEDSFAFPKLSSEATSKEDIITYLEEQTSVMDKKYKNISIIPTKQNGNLILFIAKGYVDGYNQLFLWETGKKEPTTIDDAYYEQSGNCKWLLEDKYIIMNSGKAPSDNKIIDVDKKKVISVFQLLSDDVYLIPGSSSLLRHKSKTNSLVSSFAIYNFITGEEKEILPSLNGSNLEFDIDEKNQRITFTGTITDETGIEYEIETVLTMDKLKSNYGIKTIEESEKEKNPLTPSDGEVKTDEPEKTDEPGKTDTPATDDTTTETDTTNKPAEI